jgi:hypothetical protein
MSVITAYKSDADGKIFEDKKKYQAHLRRLARHRLAQRQLMIAQEAKDAAWATLYEREQSIDDWMQMVIDNQHLFWAEAAAGDPYDWKIVGTKISRAKNAMVVPAPRVLKITHDLRWSDSVSNSHSCPVGGVTCWSSHEAKDGRPRGYPGWQGRIEWLVEWPKEFDSQDDNEHTLAQAVEQVDTLTKSSIPGARHRPMTSASMPQTGPAWLATTRSVECGIH